MSEDDVIRALREMKQDIAKYFSAFVNSFLKFPQQFEQYWNEEQQQFFIQA